MLDKDPALNGFLKKAWYLIMVIGMSVAYFVMAIGVGLWELIKSPFNKR